MTRVFSGRFLRRALLPALPLILLAVFQWLPFGLNVGPDRDGWLFLGSIDGGWASLYRVPGSANRLFVYWPYFVGHALTPDSFVGINLVVLALVAAKGLLAYALLRRLLPGRAAFALIAAALLVVYPADPGMFYLGAVAVHLCVAAFLLALLLLVIYWQRPAWPILIGALAAAGLAAGIYEVVYPLLFAAPLLLLWLERRVTRRLVTVSLIWWIVPVLASTYFLLTLVSGTSPYQESLLQAAGAPVTIPEILFYAYRQNLWTTFGIGLFQSATPALYAALALAAGVGAALAGALAARSERALARPGFWLRLALVGAAILFLGVLMYLPTTVFNTLRTFDPLRVFYFTSLGGALTMTALCALAGWAASRMRPRLELPVFLGLGGVLIALGLLRQLDQHAVQDGFSQKQQAVLAPIIEQTGQQPGSDVLLLVLDDSDGRLRQAYPLNYVFATAAELVYHNYQLNARLCYDGAQSTRPLERCAFTGAGVVVPDLWDGTVTTTFPYEKVIVFSYDPAGKVTLLDRLPPDLIGALDVSAYQPAALIHAADPLPVRYYTMLNQNGSN